MHTYIVPLRFSCSFYFSEGGRYISCEGRLSEETLKTKGLYCLLESKDQVTFFIWEAMWAPVFLSRIFPSSIVVFLKCCELSFQKALGDKKHFNCVGIYDYIVCHVKHPVDSVRNPAGTNGILWSLCLTYLNCFKTKWGNGIVRPQLNCKQLLVWPSGWKPSAFPYTFQLCWMSLFWSLAWSWVLM